MDFQVFSISYRNPATVLQRFMRSISMMLVLSAWFVSGSALFAYDGACPALPAPVGTTVTVASEAEMVTAVNSAASGTTILVEDGTYHLGSHGYYLWIDTPNVTLRSASGNREGVILDDDYSGSEMITIAASNVTVADITIMRAGTHPIHVVSTDSGDVADTLIYNVHIIDPGQQAIKINPHTAKVHYTDNGVVACSTIELTDAGRARVLLINGSCYTGGVDGHQSRGWVIRDNTIEGFWCTSGLSEHGVHFWTGSRDTVVERNRFVNNARGVGFGLRENSTGRTYSDAPCPDAVGYVGHFGGIVRNNFFFADHATLFSSEYGVDGGIALAQACGAKLLHNTIAFTQAPFAAIEWRFANSDAELTNNLTTHHLMDRGGSADLAGNLTSQPLTLFDDGANGDLHLDESATSAIDRGVAVGAGGCDDDFDGQLRPIGAARDIGADEYREASGNVAPAAVSQQMVVEQNSVNNPITLSGTDADGDALTYRVTAGPANGTLSGTAPVVYYTPNPDYSGDDSFTFVANDGTSSSNDASVAIVVQDFAASVDDGGSDSGGGGCFLHAAAHSSKILPVLYRLASSHCW